MARSMGNSAKDSELYKAYVNAQKNESLPPYLAAVIAVSHAVSRSDQPLTTLSESIALVASVSDELKACLPPGEALAITAGTDAFQKLLVTTLARPAANGQTLAASSAADTKKAILEAAKSHKLQTLAARRTVAEYGRRLVPTGSTIIVPSYSNVVDVLLGDAVDSGADFQVFFVCNTNTKADTDQKRSDLIDYLRNSEVGVAEISLDSVAQLLQHNPPTLCPINQVFTLSHTFILAGAAALLSSGGALTSLNTQSVAAVARAYNVPVVIAAESAKLVKELGTGSALRTLSVESPHPQQKAGEEDEHRMGAVLPEFITTVVNEDGPQNCATIAEDALKKWS